VEKEALSSIGGKKKKKSQPARERRRKKGDTGCRVTVTIRVEGSRTSEKKEKTGHKRAGKRAPQRRRGKREGDHDRKNREREREQEGTRNLVSALGEGTRRGRGKRREHGITSTRW